MGSCLYTFYHWVMGETVGKTDCGISLGEATITDIDFADNIVIFAETLEALVAALDTLSKKSKRLGLKVSWIKTKIQCSLLSSTRTLIYHHQLLCRENLSPLLTTLCTLGVLLAAGGDLSRRSIDVWELRPP